MVYEIVVPLITAYFIVGGNMIEFIFNDWLQVVFGPILILLAYRWKQIQRYYELLEKSKMKNCRGD